MNSQKSIWIVLGIFFVVVAGIVYLNRAVPTPKETTADTLSVVASFYPLAYLAQQVGGELVQVTTVTPPGVEPHDFEPKPSDMQKIAGAQVIIVDGAGLEPWAQDVAQTIDPAKTHYIVASEGLSDLSHEDEGTTAIDPHIWLSPVLTERIAGKIAAAYIAKDPAHKAQYEQNLSLLTSQLRALDNAYKTGLQHCARRDFVTSHAAFGYLAREYSLNQRAITGLSPESEPSAQQLAATAEFVKAQGIKVIFFESLVSPKLSDTVAQETGAQTLVLDPIEGLTAEESAAGATYMTKMQNNLNNLRIALECK